MSLTRGESAKTSTEARDRAFQPEVIEQAEALAAQYRITVRRDGDGCVGTVAEMPAVFGSGSSEAAALGTTRDLLKWALAYLIGTGRTPSPGSEMPIRKGAWADHAAPGRFEVPDTLHL